MLPMYILLNNYHRMCTESLLQLLRFCSNNGNMVQLYLSAYLSLMDCKIYIMEVCVILLLIQQLMNLNSSNSQDLDLRQAVEDQLDLILKIEQERKVLKKQNKILQQKLKQLGSCMQKYQRQTKSTEMNTEVINETSCIKNKENEKNSATGDENSNRLNVVSHQAGIQINMETINNSALMNCSKLTEARSLLKVLDQLQSRAQNIEHSELGKKNVRTSYRKQKSAEKQKQKQVKQSNQEQGNQHEKQLASEMMKLTKQLNSTKKQLKEMQHKYKLRQKEIKELKKCLQHKNQALEKSRKEFNELSILMNSDKFKSVRNLEQEVSSLKTKLIGQQDSIKIKSMLAQVTEQYEDYRRESENKIDILVSELASKQKQLEVFQNEQRKSANY